MTRSRLLNKSEIAEFGDLIGALRAQHDYSWTDLSEAAGWHGEHGSARKAFDTRYKHVHYDNLIALRRHMEDLRKSIERKAAKTAAAVATAPVSPVTGMNLMPPKGTVLRHHTLAEPPLMDLPPTASQNGDEPKHDGRRGPRPGRSIPESERGEFVRLANELHDQYHLTWTEIALETDYKSGWGIQQAVNNGGKAKPSGLATLRAFHQRVVNGEYKPTLKTGSSHGGKRIRIAFPPIQLSKSERIEFDAYISWLYDTIRYSRRELGFACGQQSKFDTSPTRAFVPYLGHLTALRHHISVDRGEDVDAILAWHKSPGLSRPLINRKAKLPFGPVVVTDADSGKTASATGGAVADATSVPVVAAPPEQQRKTLLDQPISVPVYDAKTAIFDKIDYARDELVRVSEQLGGLVGMMDAALAQKIHPLFRPGVQAARDGLAKLNDTTIAVIAEHFETE